MIVLVLFETFILDLLMITVNLVMLTKCLNTQRYSIFPKTMVSIEDIFLLANVRLLDC